MLCKRFPEGIQRQKPTQGASGCQWHIPILVAEGGNSNGHVVSDDILLHLANEMKVALPRSRIQAWQWKINI